MFQSIENNFVTDLQQVPTSYQMKHFHEHAYHELFFVIHGSCSLRIKPKHSDSTVSTQLYKLSQGSITIIPAGTPHMTIYFSGTKHERGIVYFSDSELEWVFHELGADALHQLTTGLVLQIPNRKIQYVRDLMEKICYEYKGVDWMSFSFMRTYFHTMILFLLRCNSYKENVILKMDIANQQIQDIIEYILKNYSREITLISTAEAFHMSQSSLSKKFKAFTGHRFKEYLIDVRVNAAADSLRNTSLSVTEIAAQCGFSDSNAFGDTFKRIYHMSPTEYRRCH